MSVPYRAIYDLLSLNQDDNDNIKEHLKSKGILDENYRVSYKIDLSTINLEALLNEKYLPFKRIILNSLKDSINSRPSLNT